MIPRSPSDTEPRTWQKELAESFTKPKKLLNHLGLSRHWNPRMEEAASHFSFRVPRSFVKRMHPGDPSDPLLRQVLPVDAELVEVAGFTSDPVGDQSARRGFGLLKKYQSRALLMTSAACAVNCRYCFRRHFPYQEELVRRDQLDALGTELSKDPSLTEIILSGGDPLMLNDDRLGQLIDHLNEHPQIRRLRIHTRLPVVLPSRVTDRLVEKLRSWNKSLVMVLHINHANEIDDEIRNAADKLVRSGITLLNQAVLLARVNDSASAQIELSESCFETGILPYYLHMLDPVAGSAHFDVPKEKAIEIHRALRTHLPGYLVPRLVRESAGAPFKSPVT